MTSNVNFQLDKLRVEREERARAGAPTPPPSLLVPVEQFENRNVLKPVERPDESEESEKNPDSSPEKSNGNGDSAKEHGNPDKPANDEKTEYAEMTNQRGPGNFSTGVPVQPGYPAPGHMMMQAPPSNGFAPPSLPPPPPYMNPQAQMPGLIILIHLPKFKRCWIGL